MLPSFLLCAHIQMVVECVTIIMQYYYVFFPVICNAEVFIFLYFETLFEPRWMKYVPSRS